MKKFTIKVSVENAVDESPREYVICRANAQRNAPVVHSAHLIFEI